MARLRIPGVIWGTIGQSVPFKIPHKIQRPINTFFNLMANPPYFPLNKTCILKI